MVRRKKRMYITNDHNQCQYQPKYNVKVKVFSHILADESTTHQNMSSFRVAVYYAVWQRVRLLQFAIVSSFIASLPIPILRLGMLLHRIDGWGISLHSLLSSC